MAHSTTQHSSDGLLLPFAGTDVRLVDEYEETGPESAEQPVPSVRRKRTRSENFLLADENEADVMSSPKHNKRHCEHHDEETPYSTKRLPTIKSPETPYALAAKTLCNPYREVQLDVSYDETLLSSDDDVFRVAILKQNEDILLPYRTCRLTAPHIFKRLMGWLYEVQFQFSLDEHAAATASLYLYRHIAVCRYEEFDLKNLQWIGLSCLMIASKFLGGNVLQIHQAREMSNFELSAAQLNTYEMEILKSIDFRTGRVTPMYFLNFYAERVHATAEQRTFALFFLQLSTFSCNFIQYSHSTLAACVLRLALLVTNDRHKWASHHIPKLTGASADVILACFNQLNSFVASHACNDTRAFDEHFSKPELFSVSLLNIPIFC